MSAGVLIDGTVGTFRSMKDKTVAITVYMNELDADKMYKLTQMNQEYVKMYLTKENITPEEMETIDGAELQEEEKKSPSQRFRNVIYVIWKEAHTKQRTKKVFTEFYRDFMEKQIEDLKEKYLKDE